MDLHWRLEDVENAPAFDSTCNPRCASDRAIHPIAKQLLHVPHYKLADKLNLDQDKILTELNSIDGQWNGNNNDLKGTRAQGTRSY